MPPHKSGPRKRKFPPQSIVGCREERTLEREKCAMKLRKVSKIRFAEKQEIKFWVDLKVHQEGHLRAKQRIQWRENIVWR